MFNHVRADRLGHVLCAADFTHLTLKVVFFLCQHIKCLQFICCGTYNENYYITYFVRCVNINVNKRESKDRTTQNSGFCGIYTKDREC